MKRAAGGVTTGLLLLVTACAAPPAPPTPSPTTVPPAAVAPADQASAGASASPVSRSDTSSVASPAAPAAPSGAPAAGGAPAATIGTFRSAFTSFTATFVPLWVAIDSGAFEQQGIDLQMTNTTTTAATAALLSDQLDGLFNSSPTTVSADAAGGGLVMVGSLLDHPLFSVYAQPAISSPAQLRGQPFGCGKAGTPIEFGCLMALDQMGMSPGDVSLLRLDTDEELYAALAAGQVAGTVIQPPETFLAERAGDTKLAGIPSKPFQNIGLTIKKSREEALRPMLIPVLRALQAGIRRFNSDRAFSVAVIKKYTRNDDEQLAQDTYDVYKQIGFRENMQVDPVGLQTVLDLMAASNDKVSSLRVDDLYDNAFADALAFP